jgi:hypothetical protein
MTTVGDLRRIPRLSDTNVVCSIARPEAARRVRKAVEREGATPLSLSWQAVIDGATPGRDWSALIYDLEPKNKRTAEVIDAFRSNTPAGPILLYPEPADDIGRHLEAHLGRPDVCLRLQGRDAFELHGLTADVRRVLGMVPCNRLAAKVRGATRGMPDRLVDYACAALVAVARKERRDKLSVADVAAGIGIPSRTIERLANQLDLPKPKELLDWMTLLHVTFLTEYERATWSSVTRRLGLCPRTLCRMRRRLLSQASGDPDVSERSGHRNGLDHVLLAFAERCRRCRGRRVGERRGVAG